MASETILIIDDNADVRTLLGERVLPGYGYRTLTAPDGQEGLWQIRSHNPDLILLDLRLPDMTGIDLLHILSSEGYDTPVILITAYGSELIAAQALRLGVHDYIIKPFTLDEIVASIERTLTEQRLRRERNSLHERLQLLNVAMRILADIGAEAIMQQDTDLQLCRLLEMSMAAARGRSGRLWIHELEGYGLFLRVAQDRPDQRAYLLRAGNPPPQVEQALALETFQQWEEGPPGAGQEICLAAPIVLTSWPAAVLEMRFPKEEVLSDDSRLLLLRIAVNWIGTILEWGHLRRKISAIQRQGEVLGMLSHDAMLVLNEEEVVVAATPAIETLTGQRPREIIGRNFREWAREIELPEGAPIDWYLKPSNDKRTAERYNFFFRGPQGEAHRAEVQVLVEQVESISRRYLLFHDVTAFNRLEQEARSLRHQVGEALRQARPGLLLIDPKGIVIACDKTAEEILSLDRAALLGKAIWEALAQAEGGPLLSEQIARTYREGSGYAEIRWPEKDAAAGITLTLLQGAEGMPQAIVAWIGAAQSNTSASGAGRTDNAGNLLGSSRLNSHPRR